MGNSSLIEAHQTMNLCLLLAALILVSASVETAKKGNFFLVETKEGKDLNKYKGNSGDYSYFDLTITCDHWINQRQCFHHGDDFRCVIAKRKCIQKYGSEDNIPNQTGSNA